MIFDLHFIKKNNCECFARIALVLPVERVLIISLVVRFIIYHRQSFRIKNNFKHMKRRRRRRRRRRNQSMEKEMNRQKKVGVIFFFNAKSYLYEEERSLLLFEYAGNASAM